MAMDDRPIGVFDSGLGGLTALLELRRLMPEENIVYFGDTGRLPYGEKTLAQLRVMAAQDLRLMAEQDVKAILVACGTLSSNTPELLEAFPIPTAGVLVPSIRAMAEAPGDGALGIIATAATIRSGAFERALRKACPGREIIPIPCPKLVPLIEFGHTDPEDPLLQEALEEYTAPLQKASAVLLGCTHYGIVAEGLRRLLPEDCVLVSAAACGAAAIRQQLEQRGQLGGSGEESFLVSGDPRDFARSASVLLGRSIADKVRRVPIMRIET